MEAKPWTLTSSTNIPSLPCSKSNSKSKCIHAQLIDSTKSRELWSPQLNKGKEEERLPRSSVLHRCRTSAANRCARLRSLHQGASIATTRHAQVVRVRRSRRSYRRASASNRRCLQSPASPSICAATASRRAAASNRRAPASRSSVPSSSRRARPPPVALARAHLDQPPPPLSSSRVC